MAATASQIDQHRRLADAFPPYRLACLVSHPIQYFSPLYRHVAAHPAIDLTVFYLSDLSVREYHDPGFGVGVKWDVDLLGGYRHVFLPCVGRSNRLSFWRPLTYGLRRHLEAGRFEALWVHGYYHQAELRAIRIARELGIKVLLRGESHLGCETRLPIALKAKRALLPPFFRAVDGFLAIGTLNRQYYLHYGVPEQRIFTAPYAVDNDFFRSEAARAGTTREELRRQLRLERGRPVVLYASKLMARKRPSDLLEAYVRLSPDGIQEPRPYLLFVGDGEELPRLERRLRPLGWSSVKFLGFKNQTELPRYYDLCDVFVLPSEFEPWGLVINEAMNAGKPVIVSDQVGASCDLVKDGENGFVVPAGDVAALSERLRILTMRPEVAAAMGAKSREIIRSWNFDADLQGLLASLAAIADRPSTSRAA